MTILCGPITTTISYVSQSICGPIVKIYNIKPLYETIDVQVDSQIIPGVGSVSIALAPDFTERVLISLISKNVAAGTATVVFTLESIEAPPTPTYTHTLDIFVKPHSWYSPGGAADDITTKLADISGAIINGMAEAGLSGWQYVDTDVIAETDRVTIRIYLNEKVSSMALGPWVIVGIAVAVVIIGIGIIVGYLLLKAGNKVLGESYTGKQIGEHDNQILDNIKKNCDKNIPNDPVNNAECKKSGVESVTEASGDFFKDPIITRAGEQAASVIDACIQQYNAGQITAAQLKDCSDKAIDDTKPTITEQTKDKNGGFGALLLLGLGLVGLFILTKGAGEVARPVLIERERLRAGGE